VRLDDDDLLETIRRLIAENEATLVEDMVFQTQLKQIAQLVTNNMVADTDGFFVRITTPESKLMPVPPGRTLWMGEYRVEIDMIDYARMQQEDEHFPFETVARQFRIFMGRMVELIIAQTDWLQGDRGRYRRPQDPARQVINKRDDSDILFDQAGQPYATCLGKITFYMEGQC